MSDGLRSWTVSRYKDYVTCPRQFAEVAIKRNFSKSFPAEQQRWGDAVHRAMQYAVTHNMPLPANMPYQPVVDQVRLAPGEKIAELRLALDRSRGPCAYDAAGWWHRGMIDLAIIRLRSAIVFDWKTGKRKDDPEQLMTNALLIFAHYPAIDVVVSSYIWLGAGGPPSKLTFTRDKIPEYWDQLNPTLEQLDWSLKHDVWPERPSGLCSKWCPVLTCAHNGLSKR